MTEPDMDDEMPRTRIAHFLERADLRWVGLLLMVASATLSCAGICRLAARILH